MPALLYSLLLVGACFFASLGAMAQTENAAPTTQLQQRKVYMFAVSQNLVEDLVYVAAVQEVNQVVFEENGFVANPQAYSSQFKDYVEKRTGSKGQTASIFYFNEQEKALKAWNKLREKTDGASLGGMQLKVQDISDKEFTFQARY